MQPGSRRATRLAVERVVRQRCCLLQHCCVCGPPNARQPPCEARRQAKNPESRPRHWPSSLHLRTCSQEIPGTCVCFRNPCNAPGANRGCGHMPWPLQHQQLRQTSCKCCAACAEHKQLCRSAQAMKHIRQECSTSGSEHHQRRVARNAYSNKKTFAAGYPQFATTRLQRKPCIKRASPANHCTSIT